MGPPNAVLGRRAGVPARAQSFRKGEVSLCPGLKDMTVNENAPEDLPARDQTCQPRRSGEGALRASGGLGVCGSRGPCDPAGMEPASSLG